MIGGGVGFCGRREDGVSEGGRVLRDVEGETEQEERERERMKESERE